MLSNALCYANEVDYRRDAQVQRILSAPAIGGERLLAAARLIRQRERSPLTKLSLELTAGGEIDDIALLDGAVRAACSFPARRALMDCIGQAKGEPVMLRVQAPFSALMLLVNSDRMFAWLCLYPERMHAALACMADATILYCVDALERGARILSLADPSAMVELLGKKRYRAFCADYVLRVLKGVQTHLDKALIHLCPRTSLAMEEMGYLEAEAIEAGRGNYARQAVDLAERGQEKLLGHRCINAEQSGCTRIYRLRLLV